MNLVKASNDLVVNQDHRVKMQSLESVSREMPQVEIEARHYFAHGVYVREIDIPQDTVIAGKLHRYSCVNVLSKGKVKVVTDEIEEIFQAPATFVSGAGVKKAIYALEDSVFMNIHPWDGKMTLDELEAELIRESYEEL